MRRGAVKQSVAALPAPLPTPEKPVRLCVREGCGKALKPNARKYCSHYCRNLMMGNKNGVPFTTKYKPEFAGAIFEEYLQECERGHEPTLIPTESSYIVIHNAKMPSNEDYAEWLERNKHVDRLKLDTLSDWAAANEDFAHALMRIQRIQKSFLLNNGLAGRYNPAISKLALGVNHGMVEKKEIDQTHKMIGVVKHVYGRADELGKLP